MLKQEEAARNELENLNKERDKVSEQLSGSKDYLGKAMAAVEGLDATRKKVEQTVQSLDGRIKKNVTDLGVEFPNLNPPDDDRDEAFQLQQESTELQKSRDNIKRAIHDLQNQIKSLERRIKRASELRQQLDTHKVQMAVAKELHQALQGDEFIAFIQEEAYARLAEDGSVHLKTLSGDRYSFTIDHDEFQVIDHWNANDARPVKTLSGGESFLASLALALALAEGLSGLTLGHTKFVLESLFLDEGFGALDAETLEYVVSGIEGLNTNNRLIGIISHIPELAERMPSRIQVQKSVGGSSITIN